jgi:hypothetical protein
MKLLHSLKPNEEQIPLPEEFAGTRDALIA